MNTLQSGSGSGGKLDVQQSSLGISGGLGKSNAGIQKDPILMGAAKIELHPPEVTFQDIKVEMRDFAFEKAEEAFKMMLKGEKKYYKDIAEYIKQQFDKTYGPSWHVIVGRHFGAFVTFEQKRIIQFWINHVGFLIYKFG